MAQLQFLAPPRLTKEYYAPASESSLGLTIEAIRQFHDLRSCGPRLLLLTGVMDAVYDIVVLIYGALLLWRSTRSQAWDNVTP